MLVQVHLLLLGQILQLVVSTTLNPKEHKHRRHAPKNAAQNHPGGHHKVNMIRTQNVIPFVQGGYGLPDFQILPDKQELIYPTRYLGKPGPGGQVYFIPPQARMVSVARNIRKGELMWAGEDQSEGREMDTRDDTPRRYFEGPREQRKLSVDERTLRPSEELKADGAQQPSPQGLLPKSDFNLLDNIIAKMTPDAQNALVDIILKHLEDKAKTNSVKPNLVPKSSSQMPAKQNAAQDKPPLPKLLTPALEEKHEANSPTQLVQPFSLTVDKAKLQTLYKILNDEKMKSHEPTASTICQNRNSEINDILGAEIRKSECTKCIHYVISTQTPKATKNHDRTPQSSFACSHDHSAKVLESEPVDLHSRVVNLTQIFNVHPRLLVVNSNLPTGEKTTSGSKRCPPGRPPPAKKGKESDQRKPCVKTLGPVYYVDVDDFAGDLGE